MKLHLAAVSAMALCMGLSACGDFPQPQYPVSRPLAPPPAPQSEPAPASAPAPTPADPNAPTARPSTAVESSTLAPPPGARTAPARPVKPGAFLDRGLDSGRPAIELALWRGGDDEALVYPAARHHKVTRKPKAQAAESGTVEVAKGDTLASIARAHGATVEELARLNGLKSPYRLTAGQSLKLPGAAASSSDEEAAAEPKAKGKAAEKSIAKAEETTVAKGDTLASISRKSGVSVDELARINDLDKPYRLKAGHTLKLKAEEPVAASGEGARSAGKVSTPPKAVPEQEQADSASTSTITVRRRDTIQSLARQAHVSVADLARLNHLKKPYRLKPGQSIKLPDLPGAMAGRAQSAGRAVAAEDERPAGPTVVTAGRKDTLKGIAEKHGVSVESLARLNHLKKPYRIKRGQKIRLPAPAAEERPHVQAARNPASYKVQSGDTLYSIARRFGTDARTVAELNGMEAGDQLRAGRTIRLPGGADDQITPKVASQGERAAPPPAAKPSRSSLASQAPSTPVPYSALPSNPPLPPAPGLAPPSSTPSSASSSAVASLPPSSAGATTPAYRPTAPAPEPVTAGDAEVAAAGKGLFLWPVRGDVIQRFGPLVGGQRNDGVDIAGTAGDRVVAAAAGEVVYAGNSVPGFGNLVLIRHDGGWVTAYAHLKSLDVKMRQTVTQGQEIGAVGQTGGVTQPQLHFEVRYAPTTRDKARPIDPMLVLPQ